MLSSKWEASRSVRRERAHRVEVEDRRRYRAASPILSIQLCGPEVLDDLQARLVRQRVYVTDTRHPRCSHAREALNETGDRWIASCFRNDGVGHVVKGQFETPDVVLELCEDLSRVVSRQVHRVAF